ncbi:MAG: hypothetical protein NTX29_05390 [Actinobacteria bacterium]|nr:hypothetical protein [Actinomycetota bacterium]
MWSTCASMLTWSRLRWLVAVLGGLMIAVLVALPTAVIPNPVFGRSVAVTWWSYPVVVVTAILGGLLIATYVRSGETPGTTTDEVDGATKLGMAGTLVTFFAVGCPVCNKLVLLALGASGAVTWFAPFQPFLALASIALMVVALRIRLRNETSCPVSI